MFTIKPPLLCNQNQICVRGFSYVPCEWFFIHHFSSQCRTINFNWFTIHARAETFEERIYLNECVKECLFTAFTHICKKIHNKDDRDRIYIGEGKKTFCH